MKLTQRIALLAIVGSLTMLASSKAVDFRAEVWTQYGWARIAPGSDAAGSVKKDASGYYTDRAARGETVRVCIWATAYGESSGIVRAEYTCGNQNLGPVSIAGTKAFTVSQSAACDSLHVWVRSNCYLEKRRQVPIGSRPANY